MPSATAVSLTYCIQSAAIVSFGNQPACSGSPANVAAGTALSVTPQRRPQVGAGWSVRQGTLSGRAFRQASSQGWRDVPLVAALALRIDSDTDQPALAAPSRNKASTACQTAAKRPSSPSRLPSCPDCTSRAPSAAAFGKVKRPTVRAPDRLEQRQCPSGATRRRPGRDAGRPWHRPTGRRRYVPTPPTAPGRASMAGLAPRRTRHLCGLPHGWRGAPSYERKLGSRSPPCRRHEGRSHLSSRPRRRPSSSPSSKRSFVVAKDLDIGESTLRSWRQAIATGGAQAFPAGGTRPPWRRGIASPSGPTSSGSRWSRDVLKKATAFARESS